MEYRSCHYWGNCASRVVSFYFLLIFMIGRKIVEKDHFSQWIKARKWSFQNLILPLFSWLCTLLHKTVAWRIVNSLPSIKISHGWTETKGLIYDQGLVYEQSYYSYPNCPFHSPASRCLLLLIVYCLVTQVFKFFSESMILTTKNIPLSKRKISWTCFL